MSDPSIDEIMAEVGFEMAMDKSDEADRLRARIERLEAALTGAETVMMIVEPRSHKAEYLAALAAIRAALPGTEG